MRTKAQTNATKAPAEDANDEFKDFVYEQLDKAYYFLYETRYWRLQLKNKGEHLQRNYRKEITN